MRNKNLISFVALLVMACSATAADKTVEARRARTLKLYSAAPAAFIENAGQIADPTVRYVFRGSGANIFHTTKGPVFQLFKREKPAREAVQHSDEGAEFRGLGRHPRMDKRDIVRRTCSISMRFIGAKAVRPIGRNKQESKVNYFIGDDPSKWHTDVAAYSEVVYPELYDGISLHTFGRRSHLKYEFRIAAGADYRQIVFAYKGTVGMKIDSAGALHVNTPFGELVDGAPYIYQIINGRQVQIPGRYRLIDEKSYTFEITGKVEPTTELVIDPYLVWARFLGGDEDDGAYGIAVDSQGYAYLIGWTCSDTFPANGLVQGPSDAFVAKIGPDGNRVWATYLGGYYGDDCGYGVDILETGDMDKDHVFVTGDTNSTDLPLSSYGFQTCKNGLTDAFVSKLNSNNGYLDWSSYLGGDGDDVGRDIAFVHVTGVVDSNVVMVTGATASAPTNSSCPFPNCSGNHNGGEYNTGTSDCFVARINVDFDDNPELSWFRYIGGSGDDKGYSIDTDDFDFSSIVLGASDSPGISAIKYFQGSNKGGRDAFVAQLGINWAEDNRVWCSFLGGSEDDEGYGVAVGVNQWGRYALLTGYTKSADLPKAEGYCCGEDVFVAKVRYTTRPGEPIGSAHLEWVECVAGSADEQGWDIITDIDDEGTTYGILTGWTSSYDFPTAGLFKAEHSGGTDAFVARVNENMSGDDGSLDWAAYLGGVADDKAYGIGTYVDTGGNHYAVVTGETNSVDFPTPDPNLWEGLTYNGGKDAFVAKICTDGIIGHGKLYGTVWKTDGTPISGVEVTIPGQQTYTDGEGKFSFDGEDGNPDTHDVFAGHTAVKVEEDGYYPAMKIVTIDPNSTTNVNIVMTPFGEVSSNPVVVEIYAHFCEPGKYAYYMDGPRFYEKFTTTVDWPDGCDPCRIEWRITRNDGGANQTYITDCSGTTYFSLGRSTTHSRCFDMGSDFGVGGTLEVVAGGKVSGNDVNSVPKDANFFEVTAPPPCIDANDPEAAVAVPIGSGFEYRLPGLTREFDLAGMPDIGGVPIFSSRLMNMGAGFKKAPDPLDSALVGIVYDDGTTDIYAEGWDGTSKVKVRTGVACSGEKDIDLPKIAGIEIDATPHASIGFDLTWDSDSGWGADGTLSGGCEFGVSTPPFPVPPAPHPPVYAQVGFGLDLSLSTNLSDWVDYSTGPKWASDVTFSFEPLIKGVLGAGNSDVACVEGYLGGGFHADILLSPDSVDLGDHYVLMRGGVKFTLAKYITESWELEYDWWPSSSGSASSMGTMEVSRLLYSSEPVPLPGDYLNYQDDPIILADNENVIEPNVFPYCVPEVVRIGDNMLAVWIDDDANRTSYLNQNQVVYSMYVGGGWNNALPVEVDNTADMNPQLISLGGGQAGCIWQDAKSEVQEGDNFQTFLSKIDISASIYSGGSWFGPWTLTNVGDTAFDRSPELAGDTSKMLAVWVSNSDCNMWGDGTQPNRIMWKEYKNNIWEDAAEMFVGTDFGMILDTALAYDISTGKATYVFCRDMDNDISSPNDQDLWYATYNYGNWVGPYQVSVTANNGISDVSPRLVYDNSNYLWLFWLRGEEIYYVKEPPFAFPESVTTPGKSMSTGDFDLVVGDVSGDISGQIALVWNDVSVQGSDIWMCYGEPIGYQWIWSLPLQITYDDASERFISGAFEPVTSGGGLICVYAKRQTVTDPCEIVDQNGQGHSVPGGVHKGGRSDLCYAGLQTRPDLAIAVEDVDVLPPNPVPGTWARVSAEVKNLGISSARNIVVLFSDDSGAGIWTPAPPIVGPLVGGAASEVSVWWKVPPSVSPRTVTVAIQSFDGNTEDPNNNSVSFEVLAPDLTVSEMNIHSIGPEIRVVTVRVANDGVLPIGTNLVMLRRSDSMGHYDPYEDILSGEYIQDIDPIAYQDVPFILSSGQLSEVERIYATVEIIPIAVVDNFESYTSDLNDVWEGSPNVPDGGLAYLETNVVHFGEQSMQFLYNNAISGRSVLRRIYGAAQDWTEDGVTTLRLHFYGDANGGTVGGMSVLLEDSNGVSAEIAYEGDAGDLSAKVWLEWEIDLQDFRDNNVEPDKIKKMELHITGGTTGRIYFDDILLYSFSYVPGDVNGDGVVDNADLRIIAEEWLEDGSGFLADIDGKNGVNFIDYSIFSDHLNEEYPRPTYLGPIDNDNEFNEDNNIRAVRIR